MSRQSGAPTALDEIGERQLPSPESDAVGGVPAGAILAALDLVRPEFADDEAADEALGQEASILVDMWGVPVIGRALNVIIATAVSTLQAAGTEGEADALHTVVPAVLTQLGKIPGTAPHIPMMAGVLTAAALFGDDGWRWQPGFSEVTRPEMVTWCCTANLLADLADTVVYQKQGVFVRLLAGIVTEGADQE